MTKKTTKPIRSANTAKKSTKKTKQTQGKGLQNEALRNELKELSGVEARKDMVRLAFAAILLIFTGFVLLALVSNIFTGAADQAGVLSHDIFEAHNKGGYLGAIVSYYFMQQLFGFGSLLIPVFTACVVMKLMMRQACPLRIWVTFIHCMVIMILLSLDATYLQNNVIPDAWCDYFGFELGGMHGHDIVGFMEGYVGPTTTFFILLALTIAYIGYWFGQIYIWIFKGVHKIGSYIPRSDNSDENEEEYSDEDETEDGDEDENEAGSEVENASENAGIADNDADNSTEVSAATQIELSIIDLVSHNDEEDDDIPMLADDPLMHPMDYVPVNNGGGIVDNGENKDEQPSDELIVIDSVVEELAEGKTAQTSDMALMPYDPKLDLERYSYPPIDLLEKHSSNGNPTTKEELEANKTRIIEVLRNFGVEISRISATVGPTVTLYEITPAPGVRIARIRNLEDDIALSLSALGIRIIAPIPGKGTIGIEVPNVNPQVVSMESIINTQKFKETKYELPIALGKTITNEMFMVDLAKMPHLLVAGATGQGKSVGLNAIITSLLYKKHPSELKLVMIDPKKVEFSMYNPLIKHFLAQVPDSDEPVVTDVKKVINTLQSLCREMDERYDLLKNAHCRNIKEYNAKFCERHLLPTEGHHYLPYIVVIIDEFGDLIMTAGKEIELPIARIAQLARAVGIHMVIATQSPRATIITGKIKANFPARMAFRVSQGIESQTILDRRGANNLIGKGDMLFQAGSELTRVQCAFVDTPEVVNIAKFISEQQGNPSPFELPLVADDGTDGMEGISSQTGESTFEQVAHFIVSTQMGSTSKIQRQFSIGFNRAGRLMDQLEEAGIVGPQLGSKPREVLVQSELELQRILDALKEAGQRFE